MNFVLELIPGEYRKIIQITIDEVQPAHYLVHKTLECLSCISEAKGLERKFIHTKGDSDHRLVYIIQTDRYLVIGLNGSLRDVA